ASRDVAAPRCRTLRSAEDDAERAPQDLRGVAAGRRARRTRPGARSLLPSPAERASARCRDPAPEGAARAVEEEGEPPSVAAGPGPRGRSARRPPVGSGRAALAAGAARRARDRGGLKQRFLDARRQLPARGSIDASPGSGGRFGLFASALSESAMTGLALVVALVAVLAAVALFLQARTARAVVAANSAEAEKLRKTVEVARGELQTVRADAKE